MCGRAFAGSTCACAAHSADADGVPAWGHLVFFSIEFTVCSRF